MFKFNENETIPFDFIPGDYVYILNTNNGKVSKHLVNTVSFSKYYMTYYTLNEETNEAGFFISEDINVTCFKSKEEALKKMNENNFEIKIGEKYLFKCNDDESDEIVRSYNNHIVTVIGRTFDNEKDLYEVRSDTNSEFFVYKNELSLIK